jgi:ABC-type lipoprotein export system ATPase subunit
MMTASAGRERRLPLPTNELSFVLKDLCRRKSGRSLLGPLSLVFPKTGLVIVSGANGAGKTALLSLLDGMVDYQQGSLTYHGKELKSLSSKELNEFHLREVRYVRQKNNAVSFLNAQENQNLVPYLSGEAKEKGKRKVFRKMSEGEKEICLLEGMLRPGMAVYLLDEVTAHLDDANAGRILQVLKNLAKQSLVVFVTHDHRAMACGDYQVLLAQGSLLSSTLPSAAEKQEVPLALTEKPRRRFLVSLALPFFRSSGIVCGLYFLLCLFLLTFSSFLVIADSTDYSSRFSDPVYGSVVGLSLDEEAISRQTYPQETFAEKNGFLISDQVPDDGKIHMTAAYAKVVESYLTADEKAHNSKKKISFAGSSFYVCFQGDVARDCRSACWIHPGFFARLPEGAQAGPLVLNYSLWSTESFSFDLPKNVLKDRDTSLTFYTPGLLGDSSLLKDDTFYVSPDLPVPLSGRKEFLDTSRLKDPPLRSVIANNLFQDFPKGIQVASLPTNILAKSGLAEQTVVVKEQTMATLLKGTLHEDAVGILVDGKNQQSLLSFLSRNHLRILSMEGGESLYPRTYPDRYQVLLTNLSIEKPLERLAFFFTLILLPLTNVLLALFLSSFRKEDRTALYSLGYSQSQIGRLLYFPYVSLYLLSVVLGYFLSNLGWGATRPGTLGFFPLPTGTYALWIGLVLLGQVLAFFATYFLEKEEQ